MKATTAQDLLTRIEGESGRSLSAMLELSDRCNEVCVHCYQVQGQKGELSTHDWRQIMDQLAASGVLMLTLSGGEVTLRKDFLEIVAYARQRGFAVRIFTNGLTMTADLASRLAALSVLDVEISLYSKDAAVHDFVTGVPGSFHKTVQGVRHLYEAGVSVTIKTVAMSVNEAELSEYSAFAASLGARFRLDLSALMPREGASRDPQALNPDHTHVSVVERQLRGAPEVSPEVVGAKPAHGMICGAAQSAHIEPNGQLRPCSQLEVDLGDVRVSGLDGAFESDKARAIRALRWGHLHGCRDCDLSRWCARCHAAALSETGDALGPYPSACTYARNAVQNASETEVRFVAQGTRSHTLGPYRRIAAGVYEAFESPQTSDDVELAQRLGWVRRAGGGNPAPELAIRPGELVQIRRPGRKAPKLERVPGRSVGKRDACDEVQQSPEHAPPPVGSARDDA